MNEWNDWNGMFVLCAPGCLPSTVLCFLLTVSVYMPYVVTTWATWAVWGVISQDISAARGEGGLLTSACLAVSAGVS